MDKLKLRPYQRETHDSLRDNYEKGLNRLLVRLFTGAGKTSAIAAKLPETFEELAEHGVLFLSHRREILFHAYKTFQRQWAHERWCGIDMGEMHATGLEDFVFGSVDSLGRWTSERIKKHGHRYFGIVIVDEGHHVTSDGTWDNILNYFGVGSDPRQQARLPGTNLKPLSVFLTATPQRADGQGLHPFVDAVAADYDIAYGIREGWLTDIKWFQAEYEYEYDQLSAEQQVDFLVQTWKRYAKGLRTLAFAKSVDQSHAFAATLADKLDIRAAHVSSRGLYGPQDCERPTEAETRGAIVDAFGRPYGAPDAVDILTNRLIFTEGYDNPLIQCILDNAPASHASLFHQKIGRGLRASPDARIDDCVTAAERKEAIRLSEKPYLTFITTYPPNHGISMPAALFDLPQDLKADGRMMVEEVIDLIRNEEEEMPEAPIRELNEFGEIDVKLKRVDIWTQTVYNEELKALSPLRWILDGDYAAIRLPENPFATRPIERTPAIVVWKQAGEGEPYSPAVVTEGGWIEALGHPVKPTVTHFQGRHRDLHEAITDFDAWLKKKSPELYATMQRADSGPAPKNKVKWLKRHGVRYKAGVTAETAEILIDATKIQKKLSDVSL